MKTIILVADASNWSEVTNATNYGCKFETPNGKSFKLITHKRAHWSWEGEPKEGSQAEVRIIWKGENEETTITAHKLKTLCGVAKEAKGETKTRKPLGQKLEELYGNAKEQGKTQTVLTFLLSLEDCPKWVKDAQEAEEKRVREEQRKEEEKRKRETAIEVLIAQGFSKKEAENLLNSKKGKK